MTSEIAEEMLVLEPGAHLCWIPDTGRQPQLPAVMAYVRDGLERSERCVYLADEATLDELRSAMDASGVDVSAVEREGALLLLRAGTWPSPDTDHLQGLLDAAIAEGASGIRFAVEMTALLGPDLDAEAARRWEAAVDGLLAPDTPAHVLCEYRRPRLPAGAVEAALATHPTVIVGEDACRNHYYRAPFLEPGRAPPGALDAATLDWMVARLQADRAAARDREEQARTDGAREEAERARLQVERLYRESQELTGALEQHTRALDTVNHVGRLALAELDTERTMQVVTDASLAALGAQYGALYYLATDDEGRTEMLCAVAGADSAAFPPPPPAEDAHFFTSAFQGERIVRADDVTVDVRFLPGGRHHGLPCGHPATRAYLGAALFSRTGDLVGGLCFGHEREGVFGIHEERILQGVAVQAGIAISNARFYETARRAVEVRDQFLSIAAHELKTPLTVIKGYAMLLARQLARGGLNTEQLPTTIQQLMGYSERLDTLVNNLLDTSRIQQGRLALTAEEVELSALAASVVERFEQHADRTPEHRLRVEAPEPVVGDWDLARIDQVLTTLVGNALKYSPEGGEVVVSVRGNERCATVVVRDEGIGMSEEEQGGIFQAFRGLHRSTRVVPGSGLGLYIASEIVARHGGSIRVESEPERGASFTVELALHPDLDGTDGVEAGGHGEPAVAVP
ncbi:MAG: MEDS domain-containing protein [Dehalococcoidia bacterium]